MARKRGGLAGVWDRNKKIIKPIASFAAGMVNPALGAAVGAAMGGLDREGKSGIGLDLKGAAVGGLQGYGAGKLGQFAKGKLASMFAPGGGASALGGAGSSAGAGAGSAAPASSVKSLLAPGGVVQDAGQTVAKPAGSWLARNAPVIGGVAQGASNVIGSAMDRSARAEGIDWERERFEREFERQKELEERERAERARIAQLLMPLWNQQVQQLGLTQRPPTAGG